MTKDEERARKWFDEEREQIFVQRPGKDVCIAAYIAGLRAEREAINTAMRDRLNNIEGYYTTALEVLDGICRARGDE